MIERTVWLVVPPDNIRIPAETVVIESENPLFLLLFEFPAFTAIEGGREDVTVEQPQFSFREYFLFYLQTCFSR